jgi:hypothetical protein
MLYSQVMLKWFPLHRCFELASKNMRKSLERGRNVFESGFMEVSAAIPIICNLFVKTNPLVDVQIFCAIENKLQRQNFPRGPIVDKPFYEQNLAAARAKLSEVEFNTNWGNNKKINIEEEIDCAISLIDEIQ